jgi:hypothetical protein
MVLELAGAAWLLYIKGNPVKTRRRRPECALLVPIVRLPILRMKR